MNHLEEAVCTYAKELGENRLEYSTAQLKDAKEKLKQTYLTLKEDNPNAHNNVEFMKAYRSAHGIIQHELRMRDQDSSVSVKSILGGANSGFAQGKVLTRIKRKLILGDAKHTPAEYLSLCDQLEKGNYIDINAKNDDVQGFRQFITTTYETNYRPPAESLGSRLAEIEELCSAKQDTPMNTYADFLE